MVLDFSLTFVLAMVIGLNGILFGWCSLYITSQTRQAVRTLNVEINSRMTELLKITASAAHAAGVKEQKDAQGI